MAFVLLPSQDAAHAGQRPSHHPDPVTYGQERVWLQLHAVLCGAANRFDLFPADFCCGIAERDDGENSGSRQDLNAPLQRATKKDVPRKQRQVENLFAVFPAANLRVGRLKDFEAFGTEQPGHGRLVLVFGSERKPFLRVVSDHAHRASPCDSHFSFFGFESFTTSLIDRAGYPLFRTPPLFWTKVTRASALFITART